MGQRAVFLDRDGVLTIPEFRDGRSFAPRTLDAFRVYPEAKQALLRLQKAGFVMVVVTNQPDVATGDLPRRTLDEMHRRLMEHLPIEGIEVSTATRAAPDRRRKPEPGMLIDAAGKWDIDLSQSYMVGDRATDITCGVRAGCRTVFVDHGYRAEERPTEQDATVSGIAEAAKWIIADVKAQGGKA